MLNQNSRTFNIRWFIAYILGGFAAILYLPNLIPQRPSVSDSYLFAYNNRAGVVLLLLLVTIGAVWSRGMNLKLSTTGASEPVPSRLLIVSMVAVLFGCLAVYMLAGSYGGFGESSYEIDRAWLLSQGKTPYVDFEWPFGLALLYGPVFISRLLSIGIVQAYYLFWAINCLLGTLLLFVVINWIDYPTQYKKAIYLLCFCSWYLFIVNMGTHYTLVRFVCPLFFILTIYKFLKNSGARSQVYAALLAVIFTAVLLLISPETAISFAFACISLFLICYQSWNRRFLATIAGLLFALAAVFMAASKLHVLDTVKASGAGADSFPVSLAPYILLFFSALFTCACYLFKRFSESRVHDNTIGLIAFSIPMLAAALGRCDPGHVILNGLGIFLASMFYISSHRSVWRWYTSAFVVFLIIIPSLVGFWTYLPSISRCGFNILSRSSSTSLAGRSLDYLGHVYIAHFASPSKRAKWEERLASVHDAAMPEIVAFSIFYPAWHGTFLAPIGYKPNGIGSYLSNQVDYGHFEGFENANTADAIQEKLAEIKDHPEKALLLPDHLEIYCQLDLAAERHEVSLEASFPYFGRAVHTESLRQPICDYIFAHYRLMQAPTQQNDWYGLWVANPAGS